MTWSSKMAHLQTKQIAQLAHDLSSAEGLRVPAKMAQDGFSEKDKINYLSALLQHDPGVFLERHGALLNKQQRIYFEPLREDYEVNFYMMLLEDKEKAQQRPDEPMNDSEEVSFPSRDPVWDNILPHQPHPMKFIQCARSRMSYSIQILLWYCLC